MMEKFVNEYLPRVNFVLLLVLVVMVGAIGIDYFTGKGESRGVVVRKAEDSEVVVIIQDGIFYVFDGKEVYIESLSPLVIKYQENVFKKDGRFYLYTTGNVIYIFSVHNEKLVGEKKGGGR